MLLHQRNIKGVYLSLQLSPPEHASTFWSNPLLDVLWSHSPDNPSSRKLPLSVPIEYSWVHLMCSHIESLKTWWRLAHSLSAGEINPSEVPHTIKYRDQAPRYLFREWNLQHHLLLLHKILASQLVLLLAFAASISKGPAYSLAQPPRSSWAVYETSPLQKVVYHRQTQSTHQHNLLWSLMSPVPP